MISAIYNNRVLYYDFMKDFLGGKITPSEFRKKYWSQRNKDLDKNKESGYRDYYINRVLSGDREKFKKEYYDLLNDKGVAALQEYEKGASELDIKGEMFFMGIWNCIDCDIKDFHPSDDEGFDSSFNIDEQTLIKILQIAFDVLERNKERWETT